jgi:hypothetical protein
MQKADPDGSVCAVSISRPLGCVPQRIGRIFNPYPQRQEKNKKFQHEIKEFHKRQGL